ncbi:hypothetical protein [Leptospira vanthielii]|uniref:hypothetical protein n=1 Tax=Leptospira vanthielii TaxID=293085 RepID=UPI00143D4A74|nr:hypothetical protein [Leptospira vanthielii]
MKDRISYGEVLDSSAKDGKVDSLPLPLSFFIPENFENAVFECKHPTLKRSIRG